MAELYIKRRDFKTSLSWLLQANTKSIPETNYVIDPSRYTVRLIVNFAATYFGLGEFEKALTCFNKAKAIAPNNAWVKDNEELFNRGYEQDDYMRSFSKLYAYLGRKDKSKLVDLVRSVPKDMIRDERIQHLRHDILPPNKWGDKEVVIYCYNTLFEWAAPSVIGGIGGSEEAVIYLSKELTKLGYKVTVFCNCGDLAGTYDGVTYKEFFEFNKNDEFNILISWRMNMFYGDIKAKKKLVWLHDVPDEMQAKKWFGKTDVDKVIVLSQAHKDVIPKSFDKDRIFVSSNGINMPDFMNNGVERNKYRMIYTSSYDRGIQHLLFMWGDIKKEVPEAELHLFYGWNTFDEFIKIGARSPEWKAKMVELMSQDGIFEHGRIGHKQLVKEFQRSKFFVYPSHFYEISCISAMKAQSCGCVPIVTDYAALKETVKDGVIVKGNAESSDVREDYKNAVIRALKEQPSIDVPKEQFSWENVAKQWSEELFV